MDNINEEDGYLIIDKPVSDKCPESDPYVRVGARKANEGVHEIGKAVCYLTSDVWVLCGHICALGVGIASLGSGVGYVLLGTFNRV